MALLSLANLVPQASRSLQLQKGARSLYSAHPEVQTRLLGRNESIFMFITPAFAQTSAAPGVNDIFGMMLPLLLIMVVFYFLLIRPQQRKMRDHQQMVKNVRRGDTIVTSGGLVGKVAKVVDDNEVMVDIAENVQVRIMKHALSEVRTKGEPVKQVETAKAAKK
jgi:preprotein translocase subunit YajC